MTLPVQEHLGSFTHDVVKSDDDSVPHGCQGNRTHLFESAKELLGSRTHPAPSIGQEEDAAVHVAIIEGGVGDALPVKQVEECLRLAEAMLASLGLVGDGAAVQEIVPEFKRGDHLKGGFLSRRTVHSVGCYIVLFHIVYDYECTAIITVCCWT